MIISHGRKYIFVHIPKTGGTALSLALEDRAMKDDLLIGDTPKALKRRERLKKINTGGRLWKHSKLSDIYGAVSEAEIEEFFVITLVRNPWDRIVSYFHWLREQNFKHRAVELAKSNDFEKFLVHPFTLRSIGSENFGDYVCNRAGEERCSLFARIEFLAEDLAPFEKHLGFSVGPLQRVNRSPRDLDYRQYFNDKNAEAVATIFAKDITRFGYEY